MEIRKLAQEKAVKERPVRFPYVGMCARMQRLILVAVQDVPQVQHVVAPAGVERCVNEQTATEVPGVEGYAAGFFAVQRAAVAQAFASKVFVQIQANRFLNQVL